MFRVLGILLILSGAGWGAGAQAGARGPGSESSPDVSPDTIFVHGNVLTGVGLTAVERPGAVLGRASALAVTHSTLTGVGSDAAMLKLAGPHTVIVDLHGAFVMPGFNDAHVHMALAGKQRLTVDLDNTPSLADMLERVRIYAAAAKPGSWVIGGGWDDTKWAVKTLPTRGDLDKVTGGHPAYFSRTDAHILVANSAALLAGGISAATLDPVGGKIDRDASGTPTGIVREASAEEMIFRRVPEPDAEMRQKALDVAIADALAHGVTSVQDNSPWEDWLTLETMERQGKLPLRFAEWLAFDLPLPVLKARRASHDPADPMLHLTMLKGFMDGSLGSRTAALAEPYADDLNNRGLPRYEQDKLNRMAAERAAAGFQMGFHAIGDEANTLALNAFAAAEQVAVPADAVPADGGSGTGLQSKIVEARTQDFANRDLRLRIEHAQVLLPGDFDRFKTEGVIASMQPSHLLTDMAWAGGRLGPERSQYAYAWRTMLDHGVTLAFGTDFPVESISPLRGLYAATTRRNEAGTQSFHPEQRLTMSEALYAYTQAPAYAEFRETRKGRLEAGFLADFVVLDHDLMQVHGKDILTVKVLRTVVGGKTMYQAVAQELPTPAPAVPQARTPEPEND